MKKCYETNADIYMSLLKIRLTPVNPKVPNPATLLFNRPARGLLPRLSRTPIIYDNNESNHDALKRRQPQ